MPWLPSQRLEKDRHKALQALAQAPEASRGAAREALVEDG